MAILKNGINGGFSGKIGNVVGSMYGDKCVLKSRPKPSQKNKIGSIAQNRYRLRFKNLHSFLKPLLYFIRVGFNLEGRANELSAYNAAKSYNLLHAVAEDGTLDYAKILVSKGQLPNAQQITLHQDDSGFHFSWDNPPLPDNTRLSDQFMMLAYPLDSIDLYYSLSSNRRSQRQDSLPIPAYESGKNFNIWVAFISDDRQAISNSLYLGEHCFG